MNSSYKKSLEEFSVVAFPLVKLVHQEIIKSKVPDIKILFGDNYRYSNFVGKSSHSYVYGGLLQKCYMDVLVANSDLTEDQISSVAVSSIFHTSKILNSAVEDHYVRYYFLRILHNYPAAAANVSKP